jgi:hypothetical protein
VYGSSTNIKRAAKLIQERIQLLVTERDERDRQYQQRREEYELERQRRENEKLRREEVSFHPFLPKSIRDDVIFRNVGSNI